VGYCDLVDLPPSIDYPNVHTGCQGGTCEVGGDDDPCDPYSGYWWCW
jgi:hypothetical protein